MPELQFNELKATQMAALIIQYHGGSMDLLRFTKLAYLIDRESLIRWGVPLTGDKYASMPYGMVLSRTYNLTKDKSATRSILSETIIRREGGNELTLQGDPGDSELSDADVDLIQEIVAKYKKTNIHHQLPEWIEVTDTSGIVNYADVLKKTGKSDDEIAVIMESVEGLAFAQQFT